MRKLSLVLCYLSPGDAANSLLAGIATCRFHRQ